MKAGESETFDCEDCSAEFSVTYEPKAVGRPAKEVEGIEEKDVVSCPFCGGKLCTEDDTDEEEKEKNLPPSKPAAAPRPSKKPKKK